MAETKSIPLAWVKNMSAKQREDFEQHLRNATSLIKKLREITTDRIISIEKEALNKKSYENPNWPYLQADILGEVRGLTYILELTEFMT